MKTFIALLRGINVSGHKLIKMDALREVLAKNGFVNVRSYIQSGNIVFESTNEDTLDLSRQIGSLIKQHFSYDVPVLILTNEQLSTVVKQNPFAVAGYADPVQPYVVFLSEKPAAGNVKAFIETDFGHDRYLLKDTVVYLHYAESAASTRLTNAVIEKKLNVAATSRNWKTVLKLLELSAD